MKVITIRNIPEDLYRIIVELASRNRRSIQQQVLRLLERVRRLEGKSPIEKAVGIRKKLSGRKLGDTVSEIRKERRR